MKAPPFPVAYLAIAQGIFGLLVAVVMACFLGIYGFVGVDDIPAWVFPAALLSGVACLVSAVQLWRLRWSGPISFVVLWLVPFFGSLPLATPSEIIWEASFIESRLIFLLIYAIVVFAYRTRFAPNNSFKPKPLRGSA